MITTQVISRKEVFTDQLFHIDEVEMVLPNGEKRTHHDIYRDPFVSIFPVTDSGEIYLIKQYRYIQERFLLEAVAGMIDEGEKPEDAAKRELSEEVGIIANGWKLLKEIELAGSMLRQHGSLFIAKDLILGKPHPEMSEQIELVKMPLSEAVEKVVNGEIYTASTTIGILLLDKLRQEGKI